MRVCFCGSRDWNDVSAIEKAFKDNNLHPTEDTIIHGGARGADALAGQVARKLGFMVEVFRADWDAYGRAAGAIRNRQMIKTADVVYAFWDGESRGTMDAISTAKALGIPVHVTRA